MMSLLAELWLSNPYIFVRKTCPTCPSHFSRHCSKLKNVDITSKEAPSDDIQFVRIRFNVNKPFHSPIDFRSYQAVTATIGRRCCRRVSAGSNQLFATGGECHDDLYQYNDHNPFPASTRSRRRHGLGSVPCLTVRPVLDQLCGNHWRCVLPPDGDVHPSGPEKRGTSRGR